MNKRQMAAEMIEAAKALVADEYGRFFSVDKKIVTVLLTKFTGIQLTDQNLTRGETDLVYHTGLLTRKAKELIVAKEKIEKEMKSVVMWLETYYSVDSIADSTTLKVSHNAYEINFYQSLFLGDNFDEAVKALLSVGYKKI